MQRIVQYVAQDGTPFPTPDLCAEHDRMSGFREELFKFLVENFSSADQGEFDTMDYLWDVIYKKPEKFQAVLDAATPKPRRGRPRKPQETIKPKEKEAITVANTAVIESNIEQPKKRRDILAATLIPSKWRSES